MPDLLIAPYLVLKEPVTVGPWDLVPIRDVTRRDEAAEGAEASRGWVQPNFLPAVVRLAEAYRVENMPARSSGAIGKPKRSITSVIVCVNVQSSATRAPFSGGRASRSALGGGVGGGGGP